MNTRALDRPVSFVTERILRRMEKRYDYDFSYVRHLWHVSRPAFRRFMYGFMWFSQGRDALPADAGAVAGIVATMHADCGPCTQITVNMALEKGVDPAILRATVAGDRASLGPDLCDVYDFARAVTRADYGATELRERVRAAYGEKGLADLATVIAAAQVYPMLKRTLGYGEACLKVRVAGEDVSAYRAPAEAA